MLKGVIVLVMIFLWQMLGMFIGWLFRLPYEPVGTMHPLDSKVEYNYPYPKAFNRIEYWFLRVMKILT